MRHHHRLGAAASTVHASRRGRLAVVLALAVLVGAGACGVDAATEPRLEPGSDAPAASGSGHAGTRRPFADLFRRMGSVDFDRAPTRRALADDSTVVVIGRLTELRAGRTVGSEHSDVVEQRLVHVFTVERVLKGDGLGPRIQVESGWPGYPALEDFAASVPESGRAVLYLRPAGTEQPGLIYKADGLPLGPGAPVFAPTSPQGYVIEVDGEVLTPLLLGNRPQPVFPDEPDLRGLDQFVPSA